MGELQVWSPEAVGWRRGRTGGPVNTTVTGAAPAAVVPAPVVVPAAVVPVARPAAVA